MTLAQAEAHQRQHGFLQDFAPKKVSLPALKSKPRMNRTEREYELILQAMVRRGEIQSYVYEGIRLRWGDCMHYTPDFAVFTWDDVPKLIEVKGAHIWDRDLVRFKGCRSCWKDWFDFELHQKTKNGWRQIM